LTTATTSWGVLDRPFKVRRLGHIGFNCLHPEETSGSTRAVRIRDLDRIDFTAHAPNRDELIAKIR